MTEIVLTKWQPCWKVSSLWKALLALWCHLWAYFGFFLLAADITVPVKFCSMSRSVLHKNTVLPSSLAPLFPFKYYLLAHSSIETLSTAVFLFNWRRQALVALVLWDATTCVYSGPDHHKQECSVWHLYSTFYIHLLLPGSCSSFLTPPFIHM